ncbi:condensation domain-containing protein [Actinomadura welshii]|uniref:condensation domain-containing protein n=1 Tax=Actinomadura welshii TaxID=3103817 RepID=UPI000423B45B|nr:condensation domain-containing protein [Actinomadura madurae]
MTGSAETTELPLTLGQLQHFKVTRENPALRMAIWSCFRIPGELDVDKFTDSVEILVSRHEALRIEIVERPGSEPRQRVRGLPPRAGLITVQNVLARSEDQFGRYLRHLMVQRYRREWDAGGYPFSFGLFRYSPTVHALMVGLSHMAVDGIGAGILVRDLMRTYADTLAGRAPRGPAGRRYADSVVRGAAPRGDGLRRTALRVPSGLPSPTRFDVPPPGPHERGGRTRQSSFSLAGTELAALREQAGLHTCTEFTWVLAAFARTVFRFTRQDRIAVAVPVDLRGPAERETVGMYVVEVPVVVERPRDTGAGRGFVAAVGTAVLRAAVRYRRDRAWDEEHPTDLSVNYRRMTGPDGPELARLGGTDYRPRVDYEASGVGLRIFSYRDVLHAQAVFASGLFSADAAEDLSGVLRTSLTSVPGR